MEVVKTAGDSQTTKQQNGGVEVEYVPKRVVKRVNALKNIQLKMVDIEAKFYEELHLLECKYGKIYDGLYDQREKIVTGSHEPNEQEGEFELPSGGGDKPKTADELADELKTKAALSPAAASEEPEDTSKGIPDFWLHSMKSTDIIGSVIQEQDEPVLKHLTDIRVHLNETRPYGYTLEFHFAANEYFTNKVITKSYELSTDKDEKDPFGYDGPALYRSVGCKIDWVKGKDVTVKLVKKKQKHKSTGTIRVVSKEEKQDSFFNFFESPTPDGYRPSYKKSLEQQSTSKPPDADAKKEEEDNQEEEDEETEELCEADFEIGHFFKEFLIPKAVLYYTGELIDEASYEDEDYDEEEEDIDGDGALKDISSIKNEEEEEEEEDEEEDADPKTAANRASSKKQTSAKSKNS